VRRRTLLALSLLATLPGLLLSCGSGSIRLGVVAEAGSPGPTIAPAAAGHYESLALLRDRVDGCFDRGSPRATCP
jgi:hypothetical protein